MTTRLRGDARNRAPSGATRERLAFSLAEVPGWLADDEAWGLHEAARTRAAGGASPTVVEIGSYKGRSTIALAMGLLAEGGRGRVFAIDPGDMEEGQFESFLANIEGAGVRWLVEPIRSRSHDARPRFSDGAVDVLFVDGSHEYEDVLRDVADWTPALANGAIVAFNDPFWPGVGRALRETAAVRRSPFRRPEWASQTVFFEFAPSAHWRWRDSIRSFRLLAFLALGRRWRDFHWRVVSSKRIPILAKHAQLRAAIVLFRLLLPHR